MRAPSKRVAAVVGAAVVGVAAALTATGCAATTAPDRTSAAEPAPDPFTIAADRVPVRWAPARSATLGPGVQTYTARRVQCTANFVFVDGAARVYLGQAAHCGFLGEDEHPDGCRVDTVPLGTDVDLRGDGSALSDGTTIATGSLAYSSWATMRARAEADRDACRYNDFALVRLPGGDTGRVNPSVPHWGGPTGLNLDTARPGGEVFGYGNSSLRGGSAALAPHTANLTYGPADTGGWSHQVAAFLPAIPGDSGAAYLDSQGMALGTLSTLTTAFPSRNDLGDLYRELRYAQRFSGIAGLRLVLGTEPFRPQ